MTMAVKISQLKVDYFDSDVCRLSAVALGDKVA